MANTELNKAFKKIKEYSGSATKTGIVFATGGIEQITTVAIYRCPCVEPSQLSPGCNTTSNSLRCSQQLNYGYGFAFIIAPAFALFIFSAAANPKLWKSITGCCFKSEKYKKGVLQTSVTFTTILMNSLLFPCTWICIALLDGQYLACAITALPYRIGSNNETEDCEDIALLAASTKSLPLSNAYQNNRSFSQVVGAISIVVLLFVGSVFYCITQCTFPLTYYHAKYYQLYRNMEIAEFDDEMSKKAQIEAESNVKKFLKKRQSKEMWDRISAVFQFHRDEKKLALYSQLHEWALEESNHEKTCNERKGDNCSGIELKVTTDEV